MKLVIDPAGEWMSVDQASGIEVSRATLMRRIKTGTIKTRKHGGRRQVWVEPTEEQKLRTKVDDLEGQVRQLAHELEIATHQPTYLSVSRNAEPPVDEPCLFPTKQTKTKEKATALPARSDVFGIDDAIPYEELLRQVDERADGKAAIAIEREAGLPGGFLSKARQGACRGAKGRQSWGRLAAWLAA